MPQRQKRAKVPATPQRSRQRQMRLRIGWRCPTHRLLTRSTAEPACLIRHVRAVHQDRPCPIVARPCLYVVRPCRCVALRCRCGEQPCPSGETVVRTQRYRDGASSKRRNSTKRRCLIAMLILPNRTVTICQQPDKVAQPCHRVKAAVPDRSPRMNASHFGVLDLA